RLGLLENAPELIRGQVERHGEDQKAHHDRDGHADFRAEVESGLVDRFHETSNLALLRTSHAAPRTMVTPTSSCKEPPGANLRHFSQTSRESAACRSSPALPTRATSGVLYTYCHRKSSGGGSCIVLRFRPATMSEKPASATSVPTWSPSCSEKTTSTNLAHCGSMCRARESRSATNG